MRGKKNQDSHTYGMQPARQMKNSCRKKYMKPEKIGQFNKSEAKKAGFIYIPLATSKRDQKIPHKKKI